MTNQYNPTTAKITRHDTRDASPRVADDERSEDGADTGAGAGDADRGSAGADVLGRRVDVHNSAEREEKYDTG